MLPADSLPLVSAPPHSLLVRRLEMPVRRGLIIIPDGINTSTRSNEAIIVRVGEGQYLYPWVEGDRVFLSPSVSRCFEFVGGVTLWLCHENQILAKINDPDGLGVEVGLEESAPHLMHVTGASEPGLGEDRVEIAEGDMRGKR